MSKYSTWSAETIKKARIRTQKWRELHKEELNARRRLAYQPKPRRLEGTCRITGCSKPNEALGLCSTHYRARPEFKERERENSLRRIFNLSLADEEALWVKQCGLCAICGTCLNREKYNDGAHIDHNHKNWHVRGLLCQCCNTLLGMARDDTNILYRAIDYLTEAQSRELVRANS